MICFFCLVFYSNLVSGWQTGRLHIPFWVAGEELNRREGKRQQGLLKSFKESNNVKLLLKSMKTNTLMPMTKSAVSNKHNLSVRVGFNHQTVALWSWDYHIFLNLKMDGKANWSLSCNLHNIYSTSEMMRKRSGGLCAKLLTER